MLTEKIITKIGYIELSLPVKGFFELVKKIEVTDFNVDYKNNLAGQIQNEKKLDVSLLPKSVKDTIGEGCVKYIETFGHNKLRYHPDKKKYNLQLIDCWINFQEKGEYNPLHDHGGDLSFVIWVQIPYNLQDEFDHPSCKNSNDKIASCFQFGNIQNMFTNDTENTIRVDQSYEGKAIIFHAGMQHQVYPFFTSERHRISISGNFSIIFNQE